MSRWETTSTLEAKVPPAAVWERAYADAEAWPRWNSEIKRASLDGPLTLGAKARIVFTTGLRLRFHVVEFEQGRLFTDESRLPGVRMGHRHLVESTVDGGSRLVNTIYIDVLWDRCGGGSWDPPQRERCPAPSARWSSWQRLRAGDEWLAC